MSFNIERSFRTKSTKGKMIEISEFLINKVMPFINGMILAYSIIKMNYVLMCVFLVLSFVFLLVDYKCEVKE